MHAETSALFRISPIAFDYFQSLEAGTRPEDNWAALRQAYSAEAIADFQADLESLWKGLANLPTPPPVSRENIIRRLLRHRPRNLMLFLTNACNLRCSYCYERYPGRKFERRHLSRAEVIRVIDEYFAASGARSPITVTFFGGEPLLNFEVLEAAVDHCLEKGKQAGKETYFCLTTNATILTDHMIEFLVRHRFGVMASIDGPAEFHDRHRRFPDGAGSYHLVAANIKRLLARQVERKVLPVVLRATMTRENYKYYEELNRFFQTEFPGARIMIGETTGNVEFTKEWDVPLGDVEFQQHWFHKFHAEILTASLERVRTEFREQVRALRLLHEKLHRPKGAPSLPQVCGVCRNMLALSSDGRYYPCHRFIGMDAFVLGDSQSGLNRKWIARFYAKLMDAYQKTCLACWARTLCGGDCPAFLACNDGTIHAPAPKRCQSLRKAYEYGIAIYYVVKERRPDLFRRFLAPLDAGDLAQGHESPVPPQTSQSA